MTPPRSVPLRLPGAILVVLAVASPFLLVACSPNAESQSQSPRGPSTSSRPDPSAVALEQLQGPWRPKGLPLGAPAVEAVRAACVAAATPVQSFGLTDQPVVIADARGLGLVSVVLADEFAAFECRATLSADGTSATPIEPPSRLDPASTAPLGEAAIEVVAHTRVDDPTGSRKLLIGRVGPEAFAVGILFNDESEVVATKDNGWYLAWWPGQAEPGAIVSSDMRNVVQEDVPNPAKEIEGRVAPAAWWVDPKANGVAASSSRVNALVHELSCASGTSPKGRVLEPAIFSSTDAVLVTFFVRRLAGAQDCVGNDPFPVEFSLPEPLGDRKLLDGGESPPRDASVAPR